MFRYKNVVMLFLALFILAVTGCGREGEKEPGQQMVNEVAFTEDLGSLDMPWVFGREPQPLNFLISRSDVESSHLVVCADDAPKNLPRKIYVSLLAWRLEEERYGVISVKSYARGESRVPGYSGVSFGKDLTNFWPHYAVLPEAPLLLQKGKKVPLIRLQDESYIALDNFYPETPSEGLYAGLFKEGKKPVKLAKNPMQWWHVPGYYTMPGYPLWFEENYPEGLFAYVYKSETQERYVQKVTNSSDAKAIGAWALPGDSDQVVVLWCDAEKWSIVKGALVQVKNDTIKVTCQGEMNIPLKPEETLLGMTYLRDPEGKSPGVMAVLRSRRDNPQIEEWGLQVQFFRVGVKQKAV